MIILTIRTDKPEAEIGLYDNNRQLAYHSWPAGRQLAESLHAEIRRLLESQAKTLSDIQALAAFQGPGSFTGLRIGLTVANTLAYAWSTPVVAVQNGAGKDDWLERALDRLSNGDNDGVVLPHYGGEAHITQQKK